MIWEPFVLALVLGVIVSAGLYFAYLWPQVEPLDDDLPAPPASPENAAADAPVLPAAEEPGVATT